MENRASSRARRGEPAEPPPDAISVEQRWQAITERESLTDPVRQLADYFSTRSWVDPEALFGGLVDRDARHLARLRGLLEADLATVNRCLQTIDDLDSMPARE